MYHALKYIDELKEIPEIKSRQDKLGSIQRQWNKLHERLGKLHEKSMKLSDDLVSACVEQTWSDATSIMKTLEENASVYIDPRQGSQSSADYYEPTFRKLQKSFRERNRVEFYENLRSLASLKRWD